MVWECDTGEKAGKPKRERCLPIPLTYKKRPLLLDGGHHTRVKRPDLYECILFMEAYMWGVLPVSWVSFMTSIGMNLKGGILGIS